MILNTYFSLGFASSAKFIINSVIEVYLDDHSYKKGRVNIIETMGRNAGFLAASSIVAKVKGCSPDLIYVPEDVFDIEDFLNQVEKIYLEKGHCLVVISEGIRNREFNSLEDAINYLNQDNNRYESYLEFPTTPQHGSDFVDKINEYISDGYSLDDNNCYTTGAEAYNDTNPDPYGTMLHTGNTPNYSYARNRQNGGIRHVIE